MARIELLYGPMLIGVFLNMILYGVLLVQMYTYHQTYKTDTRWIRYLVLYLFIMETANTAFDMYIIYEPLIQQFGSPDAAKFFPTLFASEPLVIVAVSTPIQVFFAWRIKLLTKSNWLAILICLFAFVSLGGIWTGCDIIILKLFSQKPRLHTPALVWFLSSCVADVLITGSLVMSLSKRRTGFVHTDDVLARIIRMTIQTGLLTAVFAIGDVLFFMTIQHAALNFIWDLALSKLYANCLLSTLNARAGLKGQATSSGTPGNRISTAPRRQMDTGNSGDNVYELDAQKTFEAAAAYPGRDVEYGITVTKVVHRVEDPAPGNGEETQ